MAFKASFSSFKLSEQLYEMPTLAFRYARLQNHFRYCSPVEMSNFVLLKSMLLECEQEKQCVNKNFQNDEKD